MSIEVCKLSDNSLSIRYDGKELYILPDRSKCTTRDIQQMLDCVESHIEETIAQEPEENTW